MGVLANSSFQQPRYWALMQTAHILQGMSGSGQMSISKELCKVDFFLMWGSIEISQAIFFCLWEISSQLVFPFSLTMTLPVIGHWEHVRNSKLHFLQQREDYLPLSWQQVCKFILYFTLKCEWDRLNLQMKLAHDREHWKTAQNTALLVHDFLYKCCWMPRVPWQTWAWAKYWRINVSEQLLS